MAFLLRAVYASIEPVLFSSTKTPDARVAEIFASQNPDVEAPTRVLADLLRNSGGNWPPTPTFVDSWPLVLRAYNATYEVVAPRFPVLESSTNSKENRLKIDAMRKLVRELLSGAAGKQYAKCKVDREAVAAVLTQAEDAEKGWEGYDAQRMQAALLGFCACICYLRQVYRWGISPVVREAQIEASLTLPLELDEPWAFFQRYLGFTSPGAGLSSCLYFNTQGPKTNFEPFYSAVHGMPAAHRRTANWDARLFIETEQRSLPMYRLIAATCESATLNSPAEALASVKKANKIFQETSQFFFENMKDENISHALWLAYLQGYTGWALPDANGVVVSGVSGGHSLTIRTLDAFLGIRPAPPEDEEALHIPKAQRDWLNVLREYDIRAQVRAAIEVYGPGSDAEAVQLWREIDSELQRMVQKLRLWRMGHMTRMVPYEAVHRPERVFMTAGRSIPPEGEAGDEAGMVHHLKGVLQERLAQTI